MAKTKASRAARLAESRAEKLAEARGEIRRLKRIVATLHNELSQAQPDPSWEARFNALLADYHKETKRNDAVIDLIADVVKRSGVKLARKA